MGAQGRQRELSKLRMSASGYVTGPRLTSKSRFHSTKAPGKSTREDAKFHLALKTVIGTTTDSGNAFESLPECNTYAVCAGSAVVLARVDEHLNITQRFYRAGPNAVAVNASTSFYSPPTLNSLGEGFRGAVSPFRDGSHGIGSPAAYGDSLTDSPGKSRASTRTRSASCVSLSADCQLLAVGEVKPTTVYQIRTDHCRQVTAQG